MIQLNLLPDIKKEVIRAQRTRTKVIIGSIITVVVTLGILVLSAVYVYAVQPFQIYVANESIKKNTQELQSQPDIRKYLSLQNQLSKLSDLHSNKPIDSRLMTFLPLLNPGEPHRVRLNKVSMLEETKQITFSGQSSTFEALSVFQDTLRLANVTYTPIAEGSAAQTEHLFSSVTLQESSLSKDAGQQAVSFIIRAIYNENAFSNKVKDVKLEVPSVSNSQSADQTTKSVFVQKAGQ